MSHNLIEEPTLWKAFFPLIFVSGDDKQVHGNISTGTVSSTSAPDEASPSIGASVPLQTRYPGELQQPTIETLQFIGVQYHLHPHLHYP